MDTSEPRTPSRIFVSGAPGSGKTTLARALAQELELPLISKDTIKEALYASAADRSSQKLSRAAMDILWAIATDCPQAVLEANFHPVADRERAARLAGPKLEIHCVCPLEVCEERYRRRAADPNHHPVHPKSISRQSLEKYAEPMRACPVIEVRTEEPVNIRELVAQVRKHWPDV